MPSVRRAVTLARSSRLELVVRPASPVKEAVSVSAWAKKGDALVPWAVKAEVSEDGAARVTGTPESLGLGVGETDVALFVGRSAALPKSGDEAAKLPLRCLARAECGLDLVQHRVQRAAQPADLGPLVLAFDPLRQVPGRDHPGRLSDRGQRTQAQPHDPESDQRDRAEHERGHEDFDEDQPVQSAVDVTKRRGDEQHIVRSAALDRRTNAVVAAAARCRSFFLPCRPGPWPT